MCLGAVAGIAGGILGGKAQSDAASDAADAQVEATQLQVDLQRDIHDQTVERFEPFLDLGTDYSNALRFELLGGDRPMIGQTDYEIETVQSPATGGFDGARVNGEGAGRGGYGSNALSGSKGLDSRVWQNPFGPMTTNNLVRPEWARDGDGIQRREPARQTREAPSITQYKVGGQTFNSMEEAQAWVDANSGGTEYQGFQATPGYQFALDQGQAAIDNSAASRGNLFSGATLKAQQKYGTGMANQEYNTYLNRLTGQASQGQAAAGNMATAGANYGSAAGAAYAGMGNAQAAGAIGRGNAISGALDNIAGSFGYMVNPGGMNHLTASNGISVPNSLMSGIQGLV